MDKIIVIVGPTAVGKTSLSIELAQKFNGEIVSGDSMQVYRNLNIGTAKATAEEMAGIPHYLLDFLPETADYSVSEFQQLAREKIAQIISHGKLPIIVGGTGLYIESLIYDVSHGGEARPNPEYRKSLNKLADMEGNRVLWDKLYSIDPIAAEKIHENNRRRVIRALEVYQETGKTYSSYQKERQIKNPLYNAFIIGLNTERDILYERINQRVDIMMKEGLVEEARTLIETVPDTSQSLKGIGYQEFIPYVKGEVDLETVVNQIKQNSRRYAKRQLTWFRNRLKVEHWYDLVLHPESMENLMNDVTKFVKGGRF